MATPVPRTPVSIERVLCLCTDSRPECLTEVRQEIRRAIAQTPLNAKAVAEMEIAAGELLSNVHRHAYPADTGPIFIEVFRTRLTVTVIVIDMGCAVVAPALARALPDRTRVTGRGLYLVSRLSDEAKWSVNAGGHGLAVRITKWFEAPHRRPGWYHHAQRDGRARSPQQQRSA
ncbi:MAG TPA: ATP-binding protein [bacterium]|nr:ATP-binding protein [bacterium]